MTELNEKAKCDVCHKRKRIIQIIRTGKDYKQEELFCSEKCFKQSRAGFLS